MVKLANQLVGLPVVLLVERIGRVVQLVVPAVLRSVDLLKFVVYPTDQLVTLLVEADGVVVLLVPRLVDLLVDQEVPVTLEVARLVVKDVDRLVDFEVLKLVVQP